MALEGIAGYQIASSIEATSPDGRRILYQTLKTASKYGVARRVESPDGNETEHVLGLGSIHKALAQLLAWKKQDGTLRNAGLLAGRPR